MTPLKTRQINTPYGSAVAQSDGLCITYTFGPDFTIDGKKIDREMPFLLVYHDGKNLLTSSAPVFDVASQSAKDEAVNFFNNDTLAWIASGELDEEIADRIAEWEEGNGGIEPADIP